MKAVNITDANKNFSKVAKDVMDEKEVLVLKNGKPRLVVLEYGHYLKIKGGKVMNLDEFLIRMENGGVWVLAEASETMQMYIKNKFPKDYEREIAKYHTPEKYIRDEENIVVVSVSDNEWCGIKAYNEKDVVFQEVAGRIVVSRKPRAGKSIITALDYQVLTGENVTVNGLRMDTTKNSPELYQKMIETGYLTKDELQKCGEEDLTAITVI